MKIGKNWYKNSCKKQIKRQKVIIHHKQFTDYQRTFTEKIMTGDLPEGGIFYFYTPKTQERSKSIISKNKGQYREIHHETTF